MQKKKISEILISFSFATIFHREVRMVVYLHSEIMREYAL